ncbi:hypothetical protein CSKR_201267 [Clonorchis sinensis]|uniref:Uncharacterized protein n=1 Tax=Clonorchis sinensis TaxID=79923 RepID=A0A8T1MPA5_CLOSI|nr:hypothetical protein CSKR_201267 [Clonorchis sinensis]
MSTEDDTKPADKKEDIQDLTESKRCSKKSRNPLTTWENSFCQKISFFVDDLAVRVDDIEKHIGELMTSVDAD